MRTVQQWRELAGGNMFLDIGELCELFRGMEELERLVEELANENRGLEAYITELNERRGHE